MRLKDLNEARKHRIDPKVLEFYANKKNWPLDLEEARKFAQEAIHQWNWPEKAPKFLALIDQAPTIKRMQELVLYPMLSGEGAAVIR